MSKKPAVKKRPKPSPVIWADPDGIVHIRNSERGTFAKCPQRWWWAWREGLVPKETAKPLWFGTGIHLALAHYYGPGKKRRKDFIDVWRQYADEEAEYVRVNIGGLDEDVWMEARTLGEVMLTGYVKEYQHDRHWDVIATEQSFEVSIPYLDGSGHFILNGTFDGVYRDKNDGKIKLMEHKTAATISTGHLPMDNQAGTYWMVAQTVGRDQGWLGPKENISEITYNFLRKGLPDERPKDDRGYATNKPTKKHYIEALVGVDGWTEADLTARGMTLEKLESIAAANYMVVLGDRSKVQPAKLFERHPVRKTPAQRRKQLERMQDDMEVMRLYVDGRLRVTKHAGRDTCPFCPFKEMCELHETGADWEEFKRALYRRADPYADHRKSAAS